MADKYRYLPKYAPSGRRISFRKIKQGQAKATHPPACPAGKNQFSAGDNKEKKTREPHPPDHTPIKQKTITRQGVNAGSSGQQKSMSEASVANDHHHRHQQKHHHLATKMRSISQVSIQLQSRSAKPSTGRRLGPQVEVGERKTDVAKDQASSREASNVSYKSHPRACVRALSAN